MKKATRKCYYCKDEIYLKDDDFLKVNKKYIHKDCYIEKQLDKGLSKEEIDVLINNILLEMKEENIKKIQKIKEKECIKQNNKKNTEKEKEYRKQFLNYLKDEYNTNLTSKYFYIKLASINNGTYRGLKEGIGFEDLLYMFKKKQNELDNIAFNKQKKGQPFKDPMSRIYFDLAVIINKYDSYKKWKEKQKILESEVQNSIKEEKNKINFEQFNFNNIDNNKNKDVDIDSLIDEI